MFRIAKEMTSLSTMSSFTYKNAVQHQQQRWLSAGNISRRPNSNGFLVLKQFMTSGSLRPRSLLHQGSSSSSSSSSLSLRFMSDFTPMTPQEEEAEKDRVSKLTPFAKEMELRDWNRQIAKLEMLRGINTGELYTWRGKFKYLARDYGVPLMVWYWTVWCTTLVCSYGAVELGGFDALTLLAQVDGYTGWSLAQHVSKEVGTFGLALAVNEILEPVRLPLVIVTTKPVVNFFYPPKY